MSTKNKNLRKIVKEEIQRAINEVVNEAGALPVGAASLAAEGPVNIFQTGTFNVDVVVNGRAEAITGQLDEDSLDILIELGVIDPGGTADQALGLEGPYRRRSRPDDPMASVGGPDPRGDPHAR